MAEAIAKFPATLIGKSEQPHAGEKNTILTFEVAGVGLAKLAVSKEDAELFPFITPNDVAVAKQKRDELVAKGAKEAELPEIPATGCKKAYVFVLVEQEKAPDFVPEPATGGDPAPTPPTPTPTPDPDPGQ